MIEIVKYNELYVRLICDRATQKEIYEQFSFQVEGHQHMPSYKNGLWDRVYPHA